MNKYQDIFNNHMKQIRMVCNATGNKPLGDTLVKLMFDFSDNLKNNNLLNGDADNDNQPKNNY